MKELKDGCVQPAKGPILEPAAKTPEHIDSMEAPKMTAQVGKPAPDFEATAFVDGEGFQNVGLSEFKGQWVVLCFYPGDFTFV